MSLGHRQRGQSRGRAQARAPFLECHEECWDKNKRCDDHDHKADWDYGVPPALDGKIPCWDIESAECDFCNHPPADGWSDDLKAACKAQIREGKCSKGTKFTRVSHHQMNQLQNTDVSPGCDPHNTVICLSVCSSHTSFASWSS